MGDINRNKNIMLNDALPIDSVPTNLTRKKQTNIIDTAGKSISRTFFNISGTESKKCLTVMVYPPTNMIKEAMVRAIMIPSRL